jgi:hypothetical protein
MNIVALLERSFVFNNIVGCTFIFAICFSSWLGPGGALYPGNLIPDGVEFGPPDQRIASIAVPLRYYSPHPKAEYGENVPPDAMKIARFAPQPLQVSEYPARQL